MLPTSFADLLPYVAELRAAVQARDLETVTRLLDAPEAMHVPRDAREEALAIVRLPRMSMRAPMQLLRFAHVARQLALGGERLLDESQLELGLTVRRPVRAAPPGSRSTPRRVEPFRPGDPRGRAQPEDDDE